MTTTVSRSSAFEDLNNRRACSNPETPARGDQSLRQPEPLSMSSLTAKFNGSGVAFPCLGNSGYLRGLKPTQSTRSATP